MKAQQIPADSSAQVVITLQQTPPSEKETITIDKLYAGMYGVTTLDDNAFTSWKANTFTSVRIGGQGTRHLTDKLWIQNTLAYDKSGGEEATISAFDIWFTPTKNTTVNVGKIPHAVTHMIAPPVVAGGHFLFTAEAQVAGWGLGAKLTQKVGNTTLIWSVARRPWYVEPSLYVANKSDKLGSLTGAVAFNSDTRELEGGLSWVKEFTDKSNIFSMVWLDPEAFSYSAMRTSKAGAGLLNDVGFFIDGQYDHVDHQISKNLIGVLKNNPGKTNLKIALGYETVEDAVKAILFVNLNK